MASLSTTQLELQGIADAPPKRATWGGRRAGAGRKPKANPGYVRHHRRAKHAKSRPVHITMRARRGLPSFRAQRILQMMTKILRNQTELGKVKRKYTDVFRVLHFSIQDNHVHVMVEADDARALRSGVSGLVIAFARQLAKLFGRKKLKVWAERFHSREVGSPQDVVNTLNYIFQNYKKHGAVTYGHGIVDRFSSAKQFDGWEQKTLYPTLLDETSFYMQGPEPWAPAQPDTWLVSTGWKQYHPPLDTRAKPASHAH